MRAVAQATGDRMIKNGDGVEISIKIWNEFEEGGNIKGQKKILDV